MFKITTPQFFLPSVEALNAGDVLSSGRTRPMIVTGICHQNGEKGEYVAKLMGSPEMWQGSSLFETLAAFIAAELGLQTPEPAAIHLSEEFVQGMDPSHRNFTAASQSIGYNFGCRKFEQFQQLLPGQRISKALQKELADMFAFDIFIGNTDRRKNKPNFLSNGKSLMLFDHEQAFSFALALPFARNPRPWTIREEDLVWVEQHFCYGVLKGKNIDFSIFTEKLSLINDKFWEKASTLIPDAWMNEHFDAIRHYLGRIIEHNDEFATELKRILS